MLPLLTVLFAGVAVFAARSGSGGGPAAPTIDPAASGKAASAGVSPGDSAKPPSATPAPSAATPLARKVIGIDPGHNGLNHTDPAALARQVWNGRSWESCDTTGTQTAGGYTEAQFNFEVATYLRADLIRDGASVVMTRSDNNGFGPCVDQRAAILNSAGADVSIDIHGDGGPVTGRGFTVLEPVADGPNNDVINSSQAFGADVHAAMLSLAPFTISDYYGNGGYIARDDLAGLNLTTMPKVLIECGNMTNQQDAALMVQPMVQQQLARALEAAIIKFLTGNWPAR